MKWKKSKGINCVATLKGKSKFITNVNHVPLTILMKVMIGMMKGKTV